MTSKPIVNYTAVAANDITNNRIFTTEQEIRPPIATDDWLGIPWSITFVVGPESRLMKRSNAPTLFDYLAFTPTNPQNPNTYHTKVKCAKFKINNSSTPACHGWSLNFHGEAPLSVALPGQQPLPALLNPGQQFYLWHPQRAKMPLREFLQNEGGKVTVRMASHVVRLAICTRTYDINSNTFTVKELHAFKLIVKRHAQIEKTISLDNFYYGYPQTLRIHPTHTIAMPENLKDNINIVELKKALPQLHAKTSFGVMCWASCPPNRFMQTPRRDENPVWRLFRHIEQHGLIHLLMSTSEWWVWDGHALIQATRCGNRFFAMGLAALCIERHGHQLYVNERDSVYFNTVQDNPPRSYGCIPRDALAVSTTNWEFIGSNNEPAEFWQSNLLETPTTLLANYNARVKSNEVDKAAMIIAAINLVTQMPQISMNEVAQNLLPCALSMHGRDVTLHDAFNASRTIWVAETEFHQKIIDYGQNYFNFADADDIVELLMKVAIRCLQVKFLLHVLTVDNHTIPLIVVEFGITANVLTVYAKNDSDTQRVSIIVQSNGGGLATITVNTNNPIVADLQESAIVCDWIEAEFGARPALPQIDVANWTPRMLMPLGEPKAAAADAKFPTIVPWFVKDIVQKSNSEYDLAVEMQVWASLYHDDPATWQTAIKTGIQWSAHIERTPLNVNKDILTMRIVKDDGGDILTYSQALAGAYMMLSKFNGADSLTLFDLFANSTVITTDAGWNNTFGNNEWERSLHPMGISWRDADDMYNKSIVATNTQKLLGLMYIRGYQPIFVVDDQFVPLDLPQLYNVNQKRKKTRPVFIKKENDRFGLTIGMYIDSSTATDDIRFAYSIPTNTLMMYNAIPNLVADPKWPKMFLTINDAWLTLKNSVRIEKLTQGTDDKNSHLANTITKKNTNVTLQTIWKPDEMHALLSSIIEINREGYELNAMYQQFTTCTFDCMFLEHPTLFPWLRTLNIKQRIDGKYVTFYEYLDNESVTLGSINDRQAAIVNKELIPILNEMIKRGFPSDE